MNEFVVMLTEDGPALLVRNTWDPSWLHRVDPCHPDYSWGCCPGVEDVVAPVEQLSLF